MPSPMDYMAHELHDPMASSSMQANNTSDVLAMQNMLAAVRWRLSSLQPAASVCMRLPTSIVRSLLV
jgi:hypothetical protein